MTESIMVQYVRFEAKALVREYTFNVRQTGLEPREYTVTISNEAFGAHRARFQDAPDICSRRLILELSLNGNHPLRNHFTVTDADLADYKTNHSPKPASRFPSHKKTDNE